RRQLWIPPGFAHGFLVLSETTDFLYKTTAYYNSGADRSVRWNDPSLNIRWPILEEPFLSNKDRSAPLLADAEY
ncbi:dTDP-4-dehydrorhamnose 3,5-epimerase family protein, partial [Escherichia coli]|uniref:dTDP-4-dehydrorhamnose 3,5-epimerase family protein n=1 Tax=Escherichia coli TaxID=562 RepID=UPI00197DE1A7